MQPVRKARWFILAWLSVPAWLGAGLAQAADPQGAQQAAPALPDQPEMQPTQPQQAVTPAQRQRLRELDRRLRILESLTVGEHRSRGLLERGIGWSAEKGERGFMLNSSDGLFRLHLNGGVQGDFRGFPAGQNLSDPGTEPDRFELTRVRPILDWRIGRFVRGQLMPELAKTKNTKVYNAFIDIEASPIHRTRIGVFKPVFSIEDQQGEFDLVFTARSLVQNLSLRRDYGLQHTMFTFRNRLRTDLGVFNSNAGAIGAASIPQFSADSSQLGMIRVMATPFLLSGPRAFRGLDLGVGVLGGDCRQSSCQQPMTTMGLDRIIFQYFDPVHPDPLNRHLVTGNGFTTWLMPEMKWFWGRMGIMADFMHTWEPKIDHVTGRAATLQNEAWMVQGEFALTDDEPKFNRLTPKRPFDLRKRGHWGGWTIAVRYSELRIDPQAFGLTFADPTKYAQTTKGYSIALGWYATREVRLQLIYDHSDLKGATPAFSGTGTTDEIVFRWTLMY